MVRQKVGDLYTTLEPCFGRSCGRYEDQDIIPCSQLIPDLGIRTVVIGLIDPDQRTNGKGVDYLTKSGVHVEYTHHGIEDRLLQKIKY